MHPTLFFSAVAAIVWTCAPEGVMGLAFLSSLLMKLRTMLHQTVLLCYTLYRGNLRNLNDWNIMLSLYFL